MSDGRRFALILLGSAWVFAWVGSFVVFAVTEPSGDGFVRGVNRVQAFFGWQGGAAMVAFVLWRVGRHWPRGSGVRRASRVPLGLAFALVLGVVALVVWARFGIG